ncbi:MFS transporter, partial [Lactococcus lactis]
NLVELLAYGILFCLTIGSFLVIEARREANQEKVVFSRKLWTIAKYRMSLIGGIVTGLSMSLFAFFPSMIEVTFQLNARKAGSFM